MEKTPNRRYAAAADLAADLGRFLRREPVLARPLGRLGRLARWGRRNPTVAGLVVAVALALIGGTVVSVAYAVRFRAAAAAARHNLDIARLDQIQQAWDEGRVGRTIDLLEQQPEDIRGFDWHYWWRQCHRERRTLAGHEFEVRAVAFAPDGEAISVATQWQRGLEVRRWDAAGGGRPAAPGRLTTDTVRGLAFSADGGLLAAVSTPNPDKDVRGPLTVWDLGTGTVALDRVPGGAGRDWRAVAAARRPGGAGVVACGRETGP